MSSTELSLVIPADKRLRKNTPILLTLPAACASNHWAVEYRNGQFLPLQQINRDQFATIAPDFEFNCEVEGKLVRLEQAPPDEVRLVPNPEMFGLDIYLGEVLLTRYVYESVPARPYFYPLFAPQGIPITRNYPMVPDVPGEITDHPHHRSLWIAHGEVNGADNWSEGGNHAKTNHLEFLSLESGTVFGRFVSKSVWATHDDIPLLEQTLETIATRPAADLARRLEIPALESLASADAHALKVFGADAKRFTQVVGLASEAPRLASIVDAQTLRDLAQAFSLDDIRIAVSCRPFIPAQDETGLDLDNLAVAARDAGPKLILAWAAETSPALRGRVRMMLPKSLLSPDGTPNQPGINHVAGKIVRRVAELLSPP